MLSPQDRFVIELERGLSCPEQLILDRNVASVKIKEEDEDGKLWDADHTAAVA